MNPAPNSPSAKYRVFANVRHGAATQVTLHPVARGDLSAAEQQQLVDATEGGSLILVFRGRPAPDLFAEGAEILVGFAAAPTAPTAPTAPAA